MLEVFLQISRKTSNGVGMLRKISGKTSNGVGILWKIFGKTSNGVGMLRKIFGMASNGVGMLPENLRHGLQRRWNAFRGWRTLLPFNWICYIY
ncbi:MAG: hypothetical protein LBD28_04235 [Tannerellaceae bacterium]|nr:hypothetical protein [Tannerellaceae bacterium]